MSRIKTYNQLFESTKSVDNNIEVIKDILSSVKDMGFGLNITTLYFERTSKDSPTYAKSRFGLYKGYRIHINRKFDDDDVDFLQKFLSEISEAKSRLSEIGKPHFYWSINDEEVDGYVEEDDEYVVEERQINLAIDVITNEINETNIQDEFIDLLTPFCKINGFKIEKPKVTTNCVYLMFNDEYVNYDQEKKNKIISSTYNSILAIVDGKIWVDSYLRWKKFSNFVQIGIDN